jgi:RNA polymerase sigma-70 factor (sigma-E family)
VRRASPPLARVGYLLTAGDAHLTQDLVQAALIAVYRSWPRLRDIAAAQAYARVALINAHRDHRRKRSSRERPVTEFPDVDDDPAGGVDARVDILAALGVLAPRQRAVVVCRFYEDMSEQQTAEALGVTVGTVKSQCHDALRRLRVLPGVAAYSNRSSADDRSER